MADFEVVDAPANLKSKVWQYFGFARVTDQNGIKTLDKTKTVCKVCEAQIAYRAGNTTNMFTHLQKKNILNFTKNLRLANLMIVSHLSFYVESKSVNKLLIC